MPISPYLLAFSDTSCVYYLDFSGTAWYKAGLTVSSVVSVVSFPSGLSVASGGVSGTKVAVNVGSGATPGTIYTVVAIVQLSNDANVTLEGTLQISTDYGQNSPYQLGYGTSNLLIFDFAQPVAILGGSVSSVVSASVSPTDVTVAGTSNTTTTASVTTSGGTQGNIYTCKVCVAIGSYHLEGEGTFQIQLPG